MSHSFATLWTIVWWAPLSLEFPRQKYWSGLPFLSPGDLPNPGIKPVSSALCQSPVLQVGSLTLSLLLSLPTLFFSYIWPLWVEVSQNSILDVLIFTLYSFSKFSHQCPWLHNNYVQMTIHTYLYWNFL